MLPFLLPFTKKEAQTFNYQLFALLLSGERGTLTLPFFSNYKKRQIPL